MTKIKLILTIAILSAVLAGCIKPTEPAGTPVPTPTATPAPTVVPTYTSIPTPTLAPTPKIPVTYKVWIDSFYGFRLVRATNGTAYINLPSNFDRFNLTINTGDSVIWINDNDPNTDFPLTLVSNEGLWENKTGYLRYSYAQFEYTFNKTGTYTVYVKEYRKNQQKITVNP